jgi:hypothetical protein
MRETGKQLLVSFASKKTCGKVEKRAEKAAKCHYDLRRPIKETLSVHVCNQKGRAVVFARTNRS